MEDYYYMTKRDSEIQFEYQKRELEKLLNMKLVKSEKNEAGADYKTTDNKVGIELSVVAHRDIYEEGEKLEENEFKYMEDDDIIYADKVANEIDPNLNKLLIVSFINNKNKIKNKIENEMLHYGKTCCSYISIKIGTN